MNSVYITVGSESIRVTDEPIEGFHKYEEYHDLNHPECLFDIAFLSKKRMNKKIRAQIAEKVMFHLQDRKIRVSMLRAVG